MTNRPAWVLTPTEEETATFAGGTPYLHPDEQWPTSDDGTRWAFLLQVDLATVPELGLNLPSEGYLQFFHKPDDLYGLNFDEIMRPNCLVRHVTDVQQHETENISPENSPLEGGAQVFYTGELVQMPARAGSFDAPESDGEDAAVFDYDFYLGGNPMFTQEDFRTGAEEVTLLLGSDSGDNLMWGDMGSAGFWLPSEALARQDFTEAFLYWDCF